MDDDIHMELGNDLLAQNCRVVGGDRIATDYGTYLST